MHFIIQFKLPHGACKYAISEQKALVISSAPAIQKSVKLCYLLFLVFYLDPAFLAGRDEYKSGLAVYHVIDFRQIHWLRGKITLTCFREQTAAFLSVRSVNVVVLLPL